LGRMTGVLGAGGRPVPAPPALPVPTLADVAAARSSRPALTAPLAGLLAAVRQARELLGPLSTADVDAAMGNVTGDLGTWEQRLRASAPAPGGDPLALAGPGHTSPVRATAPP